MSAERLGHANASMRLAVYAHLMPVGAGNSYVRPVFNGFLGGEADPGSLTCGVRVRFVLARLKQVFDYCSWLSPSGSQRAEPGLVVGSTMKSLAMVLA